MGISEALTGPVSLLPGVMRAATLSSLIICSLIPTTTLALSADQWRQKSIYQVRLALSSVISIPPVTPLRSPALGAVLGHDGQICNHKRQRYSVRYIGAQVLWRVVEGYCRPLGLYSEHGLRRRLDLSCCRQSRRVN